MMDAIAHAKAVRQRIIDAGRRAEAARAARDRPPTLEERQRASVAHLPPEAQEPALAALRAHKLLWDDVVSRERPARLVRLRRDVYVSLRALGWSLPKIARHCERRCHSSILYALQVSAKENAHD